MRMEKRRVLPLPALSFNLSHIRREGALSARPASLSRNGSFPGRQSQDQAPARALPSAPLLGLTDSHPSFLQSDKGRLVNRRGKAPTCCARAGLAAPAPLSTSSWLCMSDSRLPSSGVPGREERGRTPAGQRLGGAHTSSPSAVGASPPPPRSAVLGPLLGRSVDTRGIGETATQAASLEPAVYPLPAPSSPSARLCGFTLHPTQAAEAN